MDRPSAAHGEGRGPQARCGTESREALVGYFFQAEDGIRDDLVTGVQTCALPISLRRRSPPESSPTGVHWSLPTKPNRSQSWVADTVRPLSSSTWRRTCSTASRTRSDGSSSATSWERYAARTVTPVTTRPVLGDSAPVSIRSNEVFPE